MSEEVEKKTLRILVNRRALFYQEFDYDDLPALPYMQSLLGSAHVTSKEYFEVAV